VLDGTAELTPLWSGHLAIMSWKWILFCVGVQRQPDPTCLCSIQAAWVEVSHPGLFLGRV
jgi:hypothetical protein